MIRKLLYMFLDTIDFNENYARRHTILARTIGRAMPSRILMSILRTDCRFSTSLLTSAAVTVFRADRTTGRAEKASLAASSNLLASPVFFWCLVFSILRTNNLLKYLKICKH